jgi:hypothetical protein
MSNQPKQPQQPKQQSMLHPDFGVSFFPNSLIQDRDLPHTNFENIRQMMNELVDLGIKKDSEYGASWCKRVGPGAFFTIWRKIDRLETQCELLNYDVFNVEGDANATESLDETLLDAIFYFALLLEKRRTKQRMIAERALLLASPETAAAN